MQSVHKLISAVDILPSLTQGRKVGVMYWIRELGWMIRPCKVQFLQQLQPTSWVSVSFQMEHVTGREQRLGICELPPLPLLHVNIHMRRVGWGILSSTVYSFYVGTYSLINSPTYVNKSKCSKSVHFLAVRYFWNIPVMDWKMLQNTFKETLSDV